MKFLIDAQLPPALTVWLADKGHDAVHVATIGLIAAGDADIAEWAITENRIVISKDEDFVQIRWPDRFALLWLRCGNASNRALTLWLDPRWPEIEACFTRGERFVEAR